MALWRAKDKPPVELVVANLEFSAKFWIRRGGTRQSSISSAYSTMAKKVSG